MKFTKEDGLAIQKEQLEEWKSKLNAACYSDLLAYLEEKNSHLTEESPGYDVYRGTDLDNFIHNWKP